MSDALKAAIADLQDKLSEQEEVVRRTKRTINSLAEHAEIPIPYPDADDNTRRKAHGAAYKPDEFYGRPLAACVKQILSDRRAIDVGAATARELYDKLVEGGWHFEAKNDANAIRSLRISLRKNTAFHMLPNKTYGLTEWYPNAPKLKRNTTADDDADEDNDDTDIDEDDMFDGVDNSTDDATHNDKESNGGESDDHEYDEDEDEDDDDDVVGEDDNYLK